MKGYFRFSKYLQKVESLNGWVDSFNSRKIPWLIEKKPDSSHPNNCFLFALWRKGMEAKDSGTKRIDDGNPISILRTSRDGPR